MKTQGEALPGYHSVVRGEVAGCACRDCRIREREEDLQIHIRFPCLEGAEELNALVQEAVSRYYHFVKTLPRSQEPCSAVLQYRLWEEEEVLLLAFRSYTGPARDYAPKERARLRIDPKNAFCLLDCQFAPRREKKGKNC